ncbi:DNA polymerase zeta processivity subunit [Madurella mycetomatis]|uniref:DNA polymerase zeta processivity subunit n=1 Tax=Madurella mycetomatis TaxID=100816 RepID=A0A175WCG8_9PEZI|nr:DNA polymerase zeta processivity subunit [Madurella mycetomatis]
MPPPPQTSPNPDSSSLPLDQSHVLLTSFNSFLTVAIHNILYYRNIYPPATFLSTRAYNLPVHQNRHPKVCAWILDAVDAVSAQLSTGHVSRIAIVIHSPLNHPFPPPPQSKSQSQTPSQSPKQSLRPGSVLERWLVDTSRFPTWPDSSNMPTAASTSKAMHDFSRVLAKESRTEDARDTLLLADTDALRWPDLDEQLRGALQRMASVAERMAPLPEGCTFTVAVELDEEGRAPIGHPQPWIPSEPNLQPANASKGQDGDDIGGVKTRPIRSVEAGPLFFECWVEEGQAKEVLMRMLQGDKGASQLSTQPF